MNNSNKGYTLVDDIFSLHPVVTGSHDNEYNTSDDENNLINIKQYKNRITGQNNFN